MKKYRLTPAKAKALLRRELGMTPKALSALEDKSENPDLPWYECDCGSIRVSMCAFQTAEGYCLVSLSLYFADDSIHTLYFYTDTL